MERNCKLSKEIKLIKEAVGHLLEAELLDKNGWTKEDVETLENIFEKEFEFNWIQKTH